MRGTAHAAVCRAIPLRDRFTSHALHFCAHASVESPQATLASQILAQAASSSSAAATGPPPTLCGAAVFGAGLWDEHASAVKIVPRRMVRLECVVIRSGAAKDR